MTKIKREITKEEFEQGKNDPYVLISDADKIGYGAYLAEVVEEDGKYFLKYDRGDSCD